MPDDTKAIAILPAPRLPYSHEIKERYDVDESGWRALTEAVFPLAQSSHSVALALDYCRARRLDPFKRTVHIVPVWSDSQKKLVDTIWPGIGELRTTAFRTGLYAGRDQTEFGPDVTVKLGEHAFTYPEWCQVTVYRICGGERRAFPGPRIYWRETYATAKRDTDAPNTMWRKRPRGQLEKCAEAAALRAAFPEEIGNEYAAEEMEGQSPEVIEGKTIPPRPKREDYVDQPVAREAEGPQSQPPVATPPEPEVSDTGAEPQPAAQFAIIDSDGVVAEFAQPQDAAKHLCNLLVAATKAGNVSAFSGLWESNELARQQFMEYPDIVGPLTEFYLKCKDKLQPAQDDISLPPFLDRRSELGGK